MRAWVPWLILCIGASFVTALPAAQDDPRLDELFAELQALDKRRDDRARILQTHIWGIWFEHEDPAMTRIMGAGLDALASGRHEAAIEAFTRAIEQDPEYAEAWNRRATAWFLVDRYRDSLEDIDRVLELEPRHFGALGGRGLCLKALGRTAEAIDAFERALEINPHMDRVYIELLRLRARQGTET